MPETPDEVPDYDATESKAFEWRPVLRHEVAEFGAYIVTDHYQLVELPKVPQPPVNRLLGKGKGKEKG